MTVKKVTAKAPKTYELENLTHDFVTRYFETHAKMEVKTKRGTVYHVFKHRGEFRMYSEYCFDYRKPTKEMQKVFH